MKVAKFVLWTLGVLVLLVVLALAIVRLSPSALLAIVNGVQDGVRIDAPDLGLTYVPLSVSGDAVRLEGAGFELDLVGLSVEASWSEWWRDAPFWSAEVASLIGSTRATAESAPAAAAAPGLPVLPETLFRFKRVQLGRFEFDDLSGHALLERAERSDGPLQSADVQISGAGFVVTATGGLSVPGGPIELQTTYETQDESAPLRVDAALVGTLEIRDALMLELAQSTLTLDPGLDSDSAETAHRFSELSGRMGYGAQTRVDALSGRYFFPGAEVGEPFEVDASLVEDRLKATARLGADPGVTKATVEGRLGTSLDLDLGLASTGFPDFVDIAPFTATELYPLTASANMALAERLLTIANLTVDSPANRFTLNGRSTLDGRQVQAELAAERLTIPLVGERAEDSVDGQESEAEREPNPAEAEAELPLFPEDPIDWAWLRESAVDVKIRAQELALEEAVFQDLDAVLLVGDGVMRLTPFSSQLGDGGFTGSFELRGPVGDEDDAESRFEFELDGVSLEQFGFLPTEELTGGQVRTRIDLTSRGRSPAGLAGNLNGKVLMMIESATLKNDVVEIVGSDMFMEMLNKLNPFHKEDPSTELECAVAVFDVNDGLLSSKKNLVVETQKMKIVGDGKIALVPEDLDITFSPTARQGVGVNVGSLVKFVKLGGKLRAPTPEVDALGVLHSGAAIGAALSTGGVSVLAEGLAKRVVNAGSACARVKEGQRALPPDPEPPVEVPQPVGGETG